MSSVSSAKPQKGESENKRKTPIGFGNVNPMSTGPVFDSLDWFPGRGELLGVEAGAEGPAMGKGVSMESPKCIFFRQNRWQRPQKKASCFFLMRTKTAAEFIVTKEGRQHDNRHLVLPLSRKIGSIISAFFGVSSGSDNPTHGINRPQPTIFSARPYSSNPISVTGHRGHIPPCLSGKQNGSMFEVVYSQVYSSAQFSNLPAVF